MIDFLVSYDITNDELRKKISDYLLRKGCRRLQKSVFWANQFQFHEQQMIRGDLYEMMTKSSFRSPSDSILIIPIEKDYKDQIVVYEENNWISKNFEKKLVVFI